VTYSRIGPKHRLAAWVRMLALTAAYPHRPFEAATVGRGRKQSPVTIARIGAFGGDSAKRRQVAFEHLEALVELYDQGMREPLPLYCATSAAYAEAAVAGRDPLAAARQAWESPWNFDKEDKDPEHLLVLGGVHSFEQLLAAATDDHEGPGEARFGLFALRLWGSLLACEELIHR
jgi:exodeoxyribonuclease V gamma subunit